MNQIYMPNIMKYKNDFLFLTYSITTMLPISIHTSILVMIGWTAALANPRANLITTNKTFIHLISNK